MAGLADLLQEADPLRLFDHLSALFTAEPTRLALDTKEDPTPMDTLGSLVDKLITVDMKMWHNQEHLYAIRRMSATEFVGRYAEDMGELHAIIKRCCDLNVQRSRLMDAIDAHFAGVVNGTEEARVAAQHKTY